MVLVTLRFRVSPENRDALLEVVRGLLEPTRVEPGCRSYHFYEQIDSEGAFAFVEEWESARDLESHIRTRNYRHVMAVMDLVSEPPEIKINHVAHTEGFAFIEAALKGDDAYEIGRRE